MHKSVLKDFPDADIVVSIVWIDMLPFDGAPTAQQQADSIRDPRVTHFHDPRATKLAGHAFAHGTLREGAGVAWDVYFFYDKGATWDEHPPTPADWWHQLGGGDRADPKRFAAGRLKEKLHESMHQVTGAECAEP